MTFCVRLAGGEPEPLLPGALHRLLQCDRDALQEPPCGAGVQQHHRQPVGGLGQRASPVRPPLGRGSGGSGRAAAAGPAHLHHVQGETTTVVVLLLLLHLQHLPHRACSSPLSWASSSECAPLRRTARKRSSCNRRRTETPTLRAPPCWFSVVLTDFCHKTGRSREYKPTSELHFLYFRLSVHVSILLRRVLQSFFFCVEGKVWILKITAKFDSSLSLTLYLATCSTLAFSAVACKNICCELANIST